VKLETKRKREEGAAPSQEEKSPLLSRDRCNGGMQGRKRGEPAFEVIGKGGGKKGRPHPAEAGRTRREKRKRTSRLSGRGKKGGENSLNISNRKEKEKDESSDNVLEGGRGGAFRMLRETEEGRRRPHLKRREGIDFDLAGFKKKGGGKGDVSLFR